MHARIWREVWIGAAVWNDDRSGAGEKGKAASAVWTRSWGTTTDTRVHFGNVPDIPGILAPDVLWHPSCVCPSTDMIALQHLAPGPARIILRTGGKLINMPRPTHKKQRHISNTCQTYDLLYLLFSIERICKNVQISSGRPKSSSRLGPLSSGDIYPSTLLSKVPLISIAHRNN
jgi:hypothetical protein